jgi:hypothetical protein
MASRFYKKLGIRVCDLANLSRTRESGLTLVPELA